MNEMEWDRLYGHFRGVDDANDEISETFISTRTGDVYQAETRDLRQVCAVKVC